MVFGGRGRGETGESSGMGSERWGDAPASRLCGGSSGWLDEDEDRRLVAEEEGSKADLVPEEHRL